MSTEYMFKVLIVGQAAVGKTALIVRYFEKRFVDGYISSVGIDFKEKMIVRDGHTIRLQVWDTAGQERYKAITMNYYRGASGFIIVFDLTSADSFKNITKWVQDAREKVSDDVAIILVGNKSDATRSRVVSTVEGSKLAQFLGVKYFETSSKENSNISEVFDALLGAMMPGKEIKIEEKEEHQFPLDVREHRVIKLEDEEEQAGNDTEIYPKNRDNFCTC